MSGGVAAIVACGDDGNAHNLADAPPSGSDSALPDTPDPPAPARLTITRDGSGVESVDVYFQNADSSLVAKVPTDANGVAEATVMPGAFVTVVNPFRVVAAFGGVPQDDVRTIAGVQPGDHLSLTETNARQVLTNVTIVVPTDANSSSYKVWATCLPFDAGSTPYYLAVGSGSPNPQGSPDLYDCPTKTDLLVETENGSGVGVAYVFKNDVPVVASGTIDLTAETYTATPTVNVAYNDVPANVTGMNVTNTLATSDGPLWRDVSGLSLGSGMANASFVRPAPAGATQVLVANVFTGGLGQQTVIDWKPVADAPAFSFNNTLLKEYSNDPAFDVGTSSVTWEEDATGATADVVVAEMSAFRSGATSVNWRWQLAGVPTAATLKYPTLPTEIAQYNPITGDALTVYGLTGAKVPGGYNAVRPVVLATENPVGLVAGAMGRIVVQQYVGRALFAPLRSR